MGKNDYRNQTRGKLDTQYNQSTDAYNQFLGNINPRQTSDRANALRASIVDKYNDPNSFLPSGLTPNDQGWFNLPSDATSGGGGINFGGIGDYASARAGYQKFADTGGAEDFSDAMGSYKNFINTGGVGASEAETLRRRATSQIPAFYNAYRNAAQRRSNVQGGYSPGFDAQMQELGRAQAREGFEASRTAEADILDRVLEGRKFGTAGAESVGGRVQGGKLAGLGGLKGIGDSEIQAAIANASFGDAKSARNLAAQLQLAGLYQGGKLSSARGLTDLYGTTPGDVSLDYQTYLQGLGGLTSAQLQNLGLRTGLQNKGFNWGGLLGGIGSALKVGWPGGNKLKPEEDTIYSLPSPGYTGYE